MQAFFVRLIYTRLCRSYPDIKRVRDQARKRQPLLFASFVFCLLEALSACGGGGGLPPGTINPLPIDVLRKDPDDSGERRRRGYTYLSRGSRSSRDYSDDDDRQPSAEELLEAKCGEVSAAMAARRYADAAALLNDRAVSAVLTASRSGNYSEAKRLLDRIFAGSPCGRERPPAYP